MPPIATAILATPIDNVEESRAQRLQRQQSRFRDRGGIFIPSSRNTLADILLGKASPVKKLRRSASLSPSKGCRKLDTEKPKSVVHDHEQNLRRSPRKQGRSWSVASGAGVCEANPISRVSSHSASKALAYSPKASLVTRELPTNAPDEVDGNPALLVKGLSDKKTLVSRGAKKSQAKAQKPTKKAAGILEENKRRSKRTRTNATTSSVDLMNGHANELKLATVSSVKSSSKASSTKTRYSRKISHDIPSDDEEYEDGVASKSRRKKSTKPQPSSSNRKSSSGSSVPLKPSKARPGAPQLPDIMEENEDDVLPPSRFLSANEESTTTKKRQVIEEDPLTDPDDRPRKRAKHTRKDATVKQSKRKATPKARITSDEAPPSVPRKRGRIVDQDEDADADKKADKPGKRKEVPESEKDDEVPVRLKKNVAKPSLKSAAKARKPTVKKAPTKTAKRKENSVTAQSTRLETPRAPVPGRRGPPKSILLRLQHSSAPHVVDDEPDPIDFLS